MSDLSWEKIKDLKRPVPQKIMYIAMIVMLAIGFYLGQNYELGTLFDAEEQSIIEPMIIYADVGDSVQLVCDNTITDSKCGSIGNVHQGYKTPLMVIWDSGSTTHYKKQIPINGTEKVKLDEVGQLLYEDHKDAQQST